MDNKEETSWNDSVSETHLDEEAPLISSRISHFGVGRKPAQWQSSLESIKNISYWKKASLAAAQLLETKSLQEPNQSICLTFLPKRNTQTPPSKRRGIKQGEKKKSGGNMHILLIEFISFMFKVYPVVNRFILVQAWLDHAVRVLFPPNAPSLITD